MPTARTSNESVSSPCSRSGSTCPSRSRSRALRPRSSESTTSTIKLWQSVAVVGFDRRSRFSSCRFPTHDRLGPSGSKRTAGSCAAGDWPNAPMPREPTAVPHMGLSVLSALRLIVAYVLINPYQDQVGNLEIVFVKHEHVTVTVDAQVRRKQHLSITTCSIDASDEGLVGEEAHAAIFVTSGSYTPDAIAFAHDK